MRNPAVLSFVVLTCLPAFPQESKTVPLTVSSGVPLRLYLTKRLPKKIGEPVQAKVLEPVFAFDREVIPAGAEVAGTVSRLVPVSKMKRASAILAGDFSPLHQAEVQFTTLVLPGGRTVPLQTAETIGLTSIYSPQQSQGKPKRKKTGQTSGNTTAKAGVLGLGKDQLKSRINSQINSRTRGVADLVRGPDKRERLEEFLLNKLPYHPQWVRKGTRFDAELRQPLQFGTVAVTADSLHSLGSQPPSDSVVHARLITTLDSRTSKQGERVEAIVSQPLFSSEHKLILPEGTHLIGGVTSVHAARSFHRGGQLRFSFQKIDLPADLAAQPSARTTATLDSAESSGKTEIKVDEEGGVKAVEPKTRFIAPALSALIAAKSLDNDSGRSGEHDSNTGGRGLAGGSGFGLLGAMAAQSSRTVGSVLGFYGMGWSVYSNVVARGGEVEFDNNAAVDIRFGARRVAPGSKFRQGEASAGSVFTSSPLFGNLAIAR
ncbi:MAG: hypothetical protein ACR2NN_02325 [Bryobacteraceae bacterium]